MSYNTIARAAQDGDLQTRLRAAAAQEGHPDPHAFVQTHIWQIASHVNITGPYESAIAGRKETPGKWEDIITDAAILAVVQPLVLADLTP